MVEFRKVEPYGDKVPPHSFPTNAIDRLHERTHSDDRGRVMAGTSDGLPTPAKASAPSAAKPAASTDNRPDNNPKSAFGVKKPGTFNIPPAALLYLGRVMDGGAAKYGRFNWRENSVAISVYLDAIDRHRMEIVDGHDVDTESMCLHAAHIMACCAIILDANASGNLIDDRTSIKGPTPDVIRTLTNA